MKEIVDHLQRIAKANEDKFRYYIEINPNSKEVICYFVVEEDYDNHVFLSSRYYSELPLSISKEEIKEACANWDYKYID